MDLAARFARFDCLNALPHAEAAPVYVLPAMIEAHWSDADCRRALAAIAEDAALRARVAALIGVVDELSLDAVWVAAHSFTLEEIERIVRHLAPGSTRRQ